MDLNERLAKYLDNLEAVAGKAASFAEAEIPLVIQEWLQWQLWSSLGLSIALALTAIPLCWIVFKCTKLIKKLKPEGGSPFSASPELTVFYTGLAGFSLLGIAVLLMNSYLCASRAAKVYFAPRYAVIEQIQLLAGKGESRR